MARELNRSAEHRCYAYIVGDEVASRIERCSDDGEPSGTAGVPILECLAGARTGECGGGGVTLLQGIKLGAGG